MRLTCSIGVCSSAILESDLTGGGQRERLGAGRRCATHACGAPSPPRSLAACVGRCARCAGGVGGATAANGWRTAKSTWLLQVAWRCLWFHWLFAPCDPTKQDINSHNGARQRHRFRPCFPLAPPSGRSTHPPSSVCQADEGETKKRRKAEDDGGIGDKAIKWAEEFDGLGEDDQYTYLEELAPRMRCLPAHLAHTHAGAGLATPPSHTALCMHSPHLPTPSPSPLIPTLPVSPAHAPARTRKRGLSACVAWHAALPES